MKAYIGDYHSAIKARRRHVIRAIVEAILEQTEDTAEQDQLVLRHALRRAIDLCEIRRVLVERRAEIRHISLHREWLESLERDREQNRHSGP